MIQPVTIAAMANFLAAAESLLACSIPSGCLFRLLACNRIAMSTEQVGLDEARGCTVARSLSRTTVRLTKPWVIGSNPNERIILVAESGSVPGRELWLISGVNLYACPEMDKLGNCRHEKKLMSHTVGNLSKLQHLEVSGDFIRHAACLLYKLKIKQALIFKGSHSP